MSTNGETTMQIGSAVDPCPERAGSGEYERLVRWVRDDLADVHDPELIRELQSLPGVRRPGSPVKQVFLDAFFPPDRVRALLAEAADPRAVAGRRLTHREPLPTLDALMALGPDPAARGQIERAAALAYAALELDRSMPRRASTLLGSTQVPGREVDTIARAERHAGIAVLASGRPYLVPAASGMSPVELAEVLAGIVADAPGRAPSRILGALTSATRPTCHALRGRLLSDPENARAIAAIEGTVFVLCLDGPPATVPPASLREALPGLFSTRGNRWYGAPQIIVDAQGHAGVIEGYTRGLDAGEVIGFADALHARSREVATPLPGAGPRARLDRATPLELRCREDDPLLLAAEAEAETAFHAGAPVFSLAVAPGWFKARGLSPNAALQYLLILAAHDTWGGVTPPTLTHAVRRRGADGALDWILAPTGGLGLLRQGWQRRSCSGEDLLAGFRAFSAGLASRVAICKQAPSPCLLFSRPAGAADERLIQLFLRVAERHDSGYRGYLFRATRGPGTIDIVTSTLALPESVPYLGRPGGTSLVASRFGLHVLPRDGSLDLVYIPSPRHSADLPRFHARLEHWVGALGALTETGR